MNNQNLIIYDFQVLFDILNEIKNHLNFKLINVKKKENLKIKLKSLNNNLIISKSKIINFDNQIFIDIYPLKLSKLTESINIKFSKNKFNQQSDINIGFYKLNLNSRKLFNDNKNLDLTEKESEIIIFLKNSKNPVNISQLQKDVWGHNSKLETHTVETHIYRLRKKISKIFKNNNFIQSSKSGYFIK